MIVRDCAKLLERCIESMTGLYDYLAIVDTGSTRDDTTYIAKVYADHFASYTPKWDKPFLDDFGKARNLAMSLLPKRIKWCMWADSDEVFRDTKALRADILALPRDMNYFGMPAVISRRGEKVTKIRGSRAGKMRWFKRVHEYLGYGERILMDNKGFLLPHELAHGRSDRRGVANVARNLVILRDAQEKNPEDPHYPLCLARELHGQGEIEQAKELIRNIDPILLADDFGQGQLKMYKPMLGKLAIQVNN